MIDDEGNASGSSRRWARAGGPTARRVATPRVESSTTAAPPAARPDAPQGATLESANRHTLERIFYHVRKPAILELPPSDLPMCAI